MRALRAIRTFSSTKSTCSLSLSLSLLVLCESNLVLLFSVRFVSTGGQLSVGYLTTTPVGRKRSSELAASLTNLQSDSDYTVQLFAGQETVGFFFNVSTAPTGQFLSFFLSFFPFLATTECMQHYHLTNKSCQ